MFLLTVAVLVILVLLQTSEPPHCLVKVLPVPLASPVLSGQEEGAGFQDRCLSRQEGPGEEVAATTVDVAARAPGPLE